MDDEVYRAIAGRREFHDALRETLADAADNGCREIWLCDPDFADWPLGEIAVVESLSRWAQSHRRLLVVAQSFDEFPRRHPRWVQWRRHWSHVVQCRVVDDLEPGQMPVAMLALDRRAVRLVDPIHHRGSVSSDAASLTAIRETIDAIAQRSGDGFPVTVLGL